MTRPGLAQGLSYSKVLGSCHTASGGWGGIRTPGGREPTPVFKTGALNHSATHPSQEIKDLAKLLSRTNPELAPKCRDHRLVGSGFVVMARSAESAASRSSLSNTCA